MMFQRSLLGSSLRAGQFRRASDVHGSRFGRPFHAFSRVPPDSHAFSGLVKNFDGETHLQSSILWNLGMTLGLVRVLENFSLPCALNFRSYIHSGKQAEVDAGRTPRSLDYVQGLHQERGNGVYGRPPPLNQRQSEANAEVEAGRTPRSMDYVQGLLQERGNGVYGRPPFHQRQFEANADIVHIKLMRNNAFVTVTDSKGNKKIGVSAGKLAGKAGKLTRYSGEAAAEDIGRRVRQMKTRSVVVKVNGFTFFRKKKEAILGFKDGYSNSRGDMNPVVYIEDTTRKPHNGCRLPKKRRI